MFKKEEKVLIKTSPVKTSKYFDSKGLTLFEVLAVIVLIGIVTAIGFGIIHSNSNKDDLDEFQDTLTKTFNFASSEAVIRNKITRLILHLDKTPQTYSLQIASTSQLLLPEKASDSIFIQSKDDEEVKKEKTKFEQSFLPLPDTKEEEFSIDISIIAAGHLESEKLFFNGDFSNFFYPSSEKDPLIVFVRANEEILAISFDPFREKFKTKYFPVDGNDIKKQVEDIFKDWKS